MATRERAKEGQGGNLIDNLEVCRRLGVQPGTWRKRVQAGTAPHPHATMGSRRYYRVADIEYFEGKGVWPGHMTFSVIPTQRRNRPSPQPVGAQASERTNAE